MLSNILLIEGEVLAPRLMVPPVLSLNVKTTPPTVIVLLTAGCAVKEILSSNLRFSDFPA